jgi:DNA repair exonuclease SbcCD ATPase subunit
MKADEFLGYLNTQMGKLQQTYDEIGHVQREYQGIYVTFRADHDRTLQALMDTRAGSLPDPLPAQVEERLPAERKAMAQRADELNKQIAAKQGEADAKIAAVQAGIAEIRALNPRLDQREEQLKAMIAFRTQALHDLNAKVSKLASGLGFALHFGKIHALDNDRHRLVGQLETLNEDLVKVRKEWQEKHDASAASQAQEQAAWQGMMVEVGRLKAERDGLTADPEAQVRRRALLYVLDNLKSLPGADPELQKMAALNIQTDDFQSALGAVAGLMGTVNGVRQGLQGLAASVAALIDEQTRNSQYLPELKLDVPEEAAAFDRQWDELIACVRDEKVLAQHPTDFVRATRPFAEERLTKERIGAYFDALGGALKSATAGWKGSGK